jgi:ElaA protein
MKLPDNLTGTWSNFDELGPHDVHDLLKLRQDVFILEQTSLYADIDGKDPDALHFLIRDRPTAALVGAIRMFADPARSSSRIGRVVVAKEGRGSGLGRIMMQAGIDQAEQMVPGCSIHVTAQAHLEKFYGSLGFKTVTDPYDQDGIPHIDVIRSGQSG